MTSLNLYSLLCKMEKIIVFTSQILGVISVSKAQCTMPGLYSAYSKCPSDSAVLIPRLDIAWLFLGLLASGVHKGHHVLGSCSPLSYCPDLSPSEPSSLVDLKYLPFQKPPWVTVLPQCAVCYSSVVGTADFNSLLIALTSTTNWPSLYS